MKHRMDHFKRMSIADRRKNFFRILKSNLKSFKNKRLGAEKSIISKKRTLLNPWAFWDIQFTQIRIGLKRVSYPQINQREIFKILLAAALLIRNKLNITGQS